MAPDAAGLTPRRHVRRWPTSLAVVGVLALQLAVPTRAGLGPVWLVPLLQALLLVPLVVANPVRLERAHPALRLLALVLAAVLLGVNLARLVHLVVTIGAGRVYSAGELVLAAVVVLVTNVVAVALVFWELDRGGPASRDPLHDVPEDDPDLLFPQMTLDDPAARAWRPEFVDYLFVAFTASTAFSPTDTMPLSRSFKLLFMLAATTALTTVAVVAARAVNLA